MMRTISKCTILNIARMKTDIIVIGKVGEILFVVYTERGDRIRLISARLADKEEEAIYYGRIHT